MSFRGLTSYVPAIIINANNPKEFTKSEVEKSFKNEEAYRDKSKLICLSIEDKRAITGT